jgi:hypothetical protein
MAGVPAEMRTGYFPNTSQKVRLWWVAFPEILMANFVSVF